MPKGRILIVDDEEAVRFGIRSFLETQGFEVEEADSCAAVEQVVAANCPDGVILDYALPDGNALEVLPRLKAVDPAVPVVVLTGHGSIDLAVQAIKEGAEHFLTKPVELKALVALLERALDHRRTQRSELAVRALRARGSVDPFLGTSTAIRTLQAQAGRVLQSESPILVQGETGTGKGELARWLHANGARSQEPFVDLNCAGLSRELLESELFGHEKGAFTGAVARKAGLLEVAHRGTVFLDEIGDLPAEIQPKLLKVLEEKRFRKLGDTRDRRIDIRLIAATHQDLARHVQEGRFRSDLYYRVAAIPLRVPSLRERTEDIPMLAETLLARIAADLGRAHVRLDGRALLALGEHPWPGNIRELRNVLDRAVLLSDGPQVTAGDLRFDATLGGGDSDLGLTLEEVERRHIERVLQSEKGRVAAAARRLGIPRSSLYQKIKDLGLGSSAGTRTTPSGGNDADTDPRRRR